MNGSNIHNTLDLRLLRTLVLLLTECSVTRTAEIMGQPQPTISLSLRKLRETFNDPLLVRNGNRLIATDRGRELLVSVSRILKDLDQELSPPESFDPRQGQHHFKLLMANCFGPSFLPLIMQRIREQAPEAIVDVCPMPAYEHVAPLVAEGVADIALGNWPQPPDKLRTVPLFASDMVCLVHGKHPLAACRQLTAAQYLAAHHLSLTPSGNLAKSPIDGRLGELKLSRSIAASVPDYASVPHVLAQTDLVFTTSRHFAEEIATLVPLSVVELPEEFGSLTFYALWHVRNHRSPSHQWLRGLIRNVAREVNVLAGGHQAVPA